MTFLIVGSGWESVAAQEALARTLGARDGVCRLQPQRAADAIRPGAWDGVALCAALPPAADLAARVVQAGLPLLITCPQGLTAAQAAALRGAAADRASMVTVGWAGPVTPGLAALQLELSRWAQGRLPLSIQVEQQIAPQPSVSHFRQALLEGAVTLAHLADGWPLRVAAVSAAVADGPARAVLATGLCANGATASLAVAAGPGAPARRIRVVTDAATLLLEETAAVGLLCVQADAQPLAAAAGAESAPPPARSDPPLPARAGPPARDHATLPPPHQ